MANLNPLMLLSLLKGNGPQSVAQQLFQNNFQSNPNMQSLMQLARSGNSQGVEQFAKNYFQQIGKDYNTELNNLMQLVRNN
jgi:spore germination protein YaaH